MSAPFRLPTDVRPASAVIRVTFEFERVAIAIGDRTVDTYGEAVVLGDSRTWWIDAISAEIDEVRLSWIKPGTQLFERLRVGLHRQCGEQISARLNRAVEDQGGYAILFAEAMPVDPIERGRRRAPAFDDVYDLVARARASGCRPSREAQSWWSASRSSRRGCDPRRSCASATS